MPHPIIRRAARDDLPAIVGLLADDVLGRERDSADASDPAYAAAFAAIEADPNHVLAVMEDQGEIVGCLQVAFLPGLSRRGAWRGQIEGVRIAASRRGGGLGEVLVRWAIEECRARGCSFVQLSSDRSRTDARRFYERLGFVVSHNGFKLPL